jgi:6-phosphogluconolactonase
MPLHKARSTLSSIVMVPLLTLSVWLASAGLAAAQTPGPAVGRYAYVGNLDGALTTYAIDAATGRLRPRGSTAGLVDPAGLFFEPSGHFAYSVIRDGGSVVVSYAIDAASGALTQLPASAVIAGPDRASAIAGEPTGHFVYVTGENANQVRAYSINQTSGVLTSLGDFPAGTSPVAISVAPGGRFVYVANAASDDISAYTINATSGELQEISAQRVTAGDGPRSIAMDPQGRFVFVASANSSSVSAYRIDATSGALIAAGAAVTVRGLSPASAAVDPSGKFVYVVNNGSNDLCVLAIDPVSGVLTELGGSPFATHASPVGISIDASGKFAYVAHASREVATFAIDAGNGTLHPLSNAAIVRTGTAPSFIATTQGTSPLVFKPRFAYIVNARAGSMAGFSVNPTSGLFQSLTGSPPPFPTGSLPRSVTTDLRGRFAYVTRDGATNRVAGFSIGATGRLLAVPGSPFTTGADPKNVRIEPSTRFLYVLNKGVAPALGTVSGFTISAIDGSLAPMQSAPAVAGLLPEFMAIDPLGLFLYVANTGESTISAFRIDAVDGHLTAVQGSPFATDLLTKTIDIHPSGRFLYAANSGRGLLSAYEIDRFTGELRALAGSPFRIDDGASAVAADPLGRFIFVASTSSLVRSLTIDPQNGLPIATSQIAGPADPSSITVDPSGKFLYVTGEQSNSVRAFSIDAAGTLKVILAPFASAPASMTITATTQ